MIRVIHTDCGGIAFYFREKLKSGYPIRASNVVLKDGTPAEPMSLIECGTCHQRVSCRAGELDQQHWTDWFIPKEDNGKTSDNNQERFEDEKG